MWRARNSGGRQGRALIADWMITLAQARRKGLQQAGSSTAVRRSGLHLHS